MGFCFGDHLSKVSEEKSCLPGASSAAMPTADMRVPALHPSGPGLDAATARSPSLHDEHLPVLLLHPHHHDGSDNEQEGPLLNSGNKRLWDDTSATEDILPAKKIRLSEPGRSILKKTKFRRRFSTPRRTFFDDDTFVLEYATSRPPCEISYLMRVQAEMSLCFDDGVWFKKTVYSSDESP